MPREMAPRHQSHQIQRLEVKQWGQGWGKRKTTAMKTAALCKKRQEIPKWKDASFLARQDPRSGSSHSD